GIAGSSDALAYLVQSQDSSDDFATGRAVRRHFVLAESPGNHSTEPASLRASLREYTGGPAAGRVGAAAAPAIRCRRAAELHQIGSIVSGGREALQTDCFQLSKFHSRASAHAIGQAVLLCIADAAYIGRSPGPGTSS